MYISFKNTFNLFCLLALFLGLSFIACNKKQLETQVDSMRLKTQTEYYRGAWNSTSIFNYQDGRIVSREIETENEKYKIEMTYTDSKVESVRSKKFDQFWDLRSSIVYSYFDDKLVTVEYRERVGEEWIDYEKWTVSYSGALYDEILMEGVKNKNFEPVLKLKYTYSGDRLMNYIIYKYNDAEWEVAKEIEFNYLNDKVDLITLYYEGFGIDYGPQEQFIHEYSNNYNTRIGFAVLVDSAWIERSEIVRTFDNNGHMKDELIRLVGDPNYEYKYEYEYEEGKENFDRFPFYDQPLYEYWYPTINSEISPKSKHDHSNGARLLF